MTEEVMRAEKRAYEKVIRMIAHEVNNTTAGITSTLDTVEQALSTEDDMEDICDVMRGDMAHDIGHDGLQLADGTALALKITPAVLIHQAVIFTVVVPHRAGAVFQDIFLKHFLPVSPGAGVGKVCEHTLAAPQCSDTGFIAAAGLYKHAFGFHLIQLRMNQEDARLDVRGHGYSSLFHLSKEFPGVLEALFIPGKDAALDAFVRFHGAVAGGKLETVNRYLLFPGGSNCKTSENC